MKPDEITRWITPDLLASLASQRDLDEVKDGVSSLASVVSGIVRRLDAQDEAAQTTQAVTQLPVAVTPEGVPLGQPQANLFALSQWTVPERWQIEGDQLTQMRLKTMLGHLHALVGQALRGERVVPPGENEIVAPVKPAS